MSVHDRVIESLPGGEPDNLPSWYREFPPEWIANQDRYEPDDMSSRYGEAIPNVLSAYDDATLLDVGSSDTTGVPALAPDTATVVQVDYRRDALETADRFRDRYREDNAKVIGGIPCQADARQLPFREDTFDAVFAGAYLTEQDEPDAGLSPEGSELYRVLRQDGDLLIASKYIGRAETADDAVRQYGIEKEADDRFESYRCEDDLLILSSYCG